MKKILSLILALSLIISATPMSFAEDVAEEPIDEPGMYFNFNAAAFGEKEDITADKIDENDEATEPVFASIDSDPWRIDGQRSLVDYSITAGTQDASNSYKMPNALWWQKAYSSRGKNLAGIVIRLKINETGVFTPTLTYNTGYTSNRYAFFIGPVSLRSSGYKMDDGNGSRTTGDVNVTNKAPISLAFDATTRSPSLHALTTTLNLWTASNKKATETFDPITITEPGEYYFYAITNAREGNTPYSAVKTYNINLYSLHLTPTPAKDLADKAFTATQDPEYSNETAPETAFVKTLALYGETSAVIETADVTYGASTSIPAVDKTYTDEDGDTYNFLYWAKGLDNGVGNKHIISTSNEQFSYKPHEGANYLIAVYEKEGEEKEAAFYDRNGQLLNLEITDSKLPALPAMAGLGNAIGWEQLGTGEEFAAGADVTDLEGDKVFMAKYDELSENIAITVEDGTGSGNYAYGDTVECKIDETKKDTFSYWEKTINGKSQIVSLEETYTFNAWEDCTVKAVCNGAFDLGRTARKIVLSTFSVGDNLTAVMAEFIGFEGAKEKGIMFGTKKIAMTTDYAQFTVTNDTAASVTVTGYAIVDEAGTTVKYTDGSISVPGATAE